MTGIASLAGILLKHKLENSRARNQSNQQGQSLSSNELKNRYRDLARDARRELVFWLLVVAACSLATFATRITIEDFAAAANFPGVIVVFSFLFVALRSLVLMIYYALRGGGLE